ncbi:type II secretion system F family protein [Arthrobacter sp. TMN-50]
MTGLMLFVLLSMVVLLLTGYGVRGSGGWRPGTGGQPPGIRGGPGADPGAKPPPRQGRSGTSSRPAQRDPDQIDPALMIDLLGAMLAAGAPIGAALAVLGDSCPPSLSLSLQRVQGALALGADWETAWSTAVAQTDGTTGKTLRELGGALRFAALTGASSAGIVHACAGQLRRRRNSEAEQRAATLGVRLVLPLGLCYLPAFICLGVLPVVFALVPQWG